MKRKSRKEKEKQETTLLGSTLFKVATKLALTLVIVACFLTLIQCSIKTPESPQWSTQFAIPVVNRTYDMEELIAKADQDGLSFDSSGAISFNFSQAFDTVSLPDDIMTTSDLYYVADDSLGAVDIDPPASTPITVSLANIVGLGSSLPGDTAIIPGLAFNITNSLPTIQTYSEIEVDQGSLYAVFTNNLGVQLDTVVMQLYDMDSLRSVAVDTFPGVFLPGVTDSLELILDGSIISNNLRLLSFCYTPGGLVDSVSTRDMNSSISFSDQLTVAAAFTKVPAFTRNFVATVPLNESDHIDSAGLASGEMMITITNSTNLNGDMTISLPNIFQSDVPVSVVRTVPAGRSTQITVPLAGATLMPADSSGSQSVNIQIDIALPGSGDLMVRVTPSDRITVNANITNLNFDYVSGIFGAKTADFTGIQQVLDIPSGLDSVEFANIEISLDIDNNFRLPGDLALTLVGSNGKTLDISGSIHPESITTISRNDAAVSAFLNPFPETVDINGTATMAGDGQLGTITNGDFITGQVRIFAPLEIIVHPTKIETDIESQTINQNDIDAITGHVLSARLIYEIENSLPLGANIALYFGPDSASLLSTPQLLIDSLIVPSAPFGIDGLSTGTSTSGEQIIMLDSIDIKVIENPILFIGQDLWLEGSGGQVIRFSQSDYITVRARIEIEYLFDGEF